MEPLRFGGLVIVGTCTKCKMVIWGPEGTQKAEHGYCGIKRPKND